MNSVCRLFDPLTPTLSRWERELTAPVFSETMLIMAGKQIIKRPAISMLGLNSLSHRERARVRVRVRVRGYKTPLQPLLTDALCVKEGES
jgi:hypothetical protein